MTETILHVVAKPDPDHPDATRAYLQGVFPLLTGAGGELLARTTVSRVIHGTPPGVMTLAMRFPDADVVTAMFDGPEYGALRGLRDEGFSSMDIYLGQPMP